MDEEVTATPQATTLAGPVGLGGWLILPAIGMFINLYIFGKSTLGIAALALPGVLDKLAAAGVNVHDPAWARLIGLEAISFPILFLFDITLLILFFTRSYWFPRAMIGFLILVLIVVSLDTFFAQWVTLPDSEDSGGTAMKLARPVIVCAIWIPYFLTSVQVKNTFVRHRAAPAAG
jgi:hypothetical protein